MKGSISDNIQSIGPYKIYLNTKLGIGQQGIVYRATKEGISTDICCKIVRIIKDDPQVLAMVKREMAILDSLKDSNNEYLIKSYDVYENANLQQIMIFMEYCDGGDLRSSIDKRIKANVQYTLEEIIVFIKQMALAYRTLYDNKIIHRDIKPANILLLKSGMYKLADFGFGKIIEDVTECIFHTKAGTPVYAAPQLFLPDEICKFSSKCDMYSLGIIIYQMTYMGLPFILSGAQLSQFHHKIKNGGLKCPIPKIEGNKEEIQQLIELLERMVTYSEEKRISWPELFEHPFVKRKSNEQATQEKQDLIKQEQALCLYDSIFINKGQAAQFDYAAFAIVSGMKDSSKSSRLQHFLKVTLAKSMFCKALLDLFQSNDIIGFLQQKGVNIFQYHLLLTCLLGYQNKILINAFGFSNNQLNYIATRIKQIFDQNDLQTAMKQLEQDLSVQCHQIKKQILQDVQESNQIFVEQQNNLVKLFSQYQYKYDIQNFKKLLGLLQDKIEYALYGSWFKFFYDNDYKSLLVYDNTRPYPLEYLRFIALSEQFIGLETDYPLDAYLSQSPEQISAPIQYNEQQLRELIKSKRGM